MGWVMLAIAGLVGLLVMAWIATVEMPDFGGMTLSIVLTGIMVTAIRAAIQGGGES